MLKGLTRTLVALSASILALGCTTLRPVTGSPADLQQRITSGALLAPGDRVEIETLDHRVHQFTVTSIESSVIYGPHEAISIDQILAVQKRALDVRRTGQLVEVTLLGVILAGVAVVLHGGVGLPGGG